jgi:RNA polymerase sigma factor (sigma-70 family)
MASSSSNIKPGVEAPGRAERINSAVDREYESLLRSVAVMVHRGDASLRWAAVLDLARDVLHEAVGVALEHAESFDPERSATAWIRGIAARVLAGRRRSEKRARRCVNATALGDQGWQTALASLSSRPACETVDDRIDLEQAMARLRPGERRILTLRYDEEMGGEQLAGALGLSNAGAARVQLCRAMQALRDQYARKGKVLS